MASKSLLLVPVALCLLLVLAAQGALLAAGSGTVSISGTVTCSNNPSTTVSKATVKVMINGKTVATVETTRTGQFMAQVKVTSTELISPSSPDSIRVTVTPPPNACGSSSNGAVKVAAQASVPVNAAVVSAP